MAPSHPSQLLRHFSFPLPRPSPSHRRPLSPSQIHPILPQPPAQRLWTSNSTLPTIPRYASNCFQLHSRSPSPKYIPCTCGKIMISRTSCRQLLEIKINMGSLRRFHATPPKKDVGRVDICRFVSLHPPHSMNLHCTPLKISVASSPQKILSRCWH